MILTILSAAAIIGMLLYASWRNKGLPECLSDCYYIIGLPFTFIFFAACMLKTSPAQPMFLLLHKMVQIGVPAV